MQKISLISFLFLFFFNYAIKGQNAFVDNKNHEAISLLSKLIQFKSNSGKEQEIGSYLSNYCQEKGLNIHLFNKNDSMFNFSASLYPLNCGKPNIVFMSHLDVVSEGDTADWTYPAYSGKITETEIWGRGAIDCKGMAVMQISAILNFIKISKEKDLPFNLTFLAVCNEEVNSSMGAGYISKNFLKEINPAVIFGEGGSGMIGLIPSDTNKIVFGISIAEKSTLWLNLEAKTKRSGHGAAPSELYANKRLIKALIKLLDEKRAISFDKITLRMFRELGEMEGGLNGFIIKHINWKIFWPFVKKYFREDEPFHILVYNTFVVTHISNPNVNDNQIANKATATLDCRLLPGTDEKKFLKKMKQTVGPRISISIISKSPTALPTIPDKYYENMEKSISKIFPNSKTVPILFPATSDNNYFRDKGIPVFGLIPTILSKDLLETVHSSNERIRISDLENGIKVYSEFIINIINQ
ncbi:MAG: M20/M25/M40 family metallo-hydrolase [Bacteroidetes bacterium]|nr:M20/M25/M40 family metallo-hydrolase [Bacteroidota bacterium]